MDVAPTYDEENYIYTGVVRRPFHCPFYTAPYPGGYKTGLRLEAGQSTGPLTCFTLSPDGAYVGARTELGWWVNIWCRFNKTGKAVPGGVFFVEVSAKVKGSSSSGCGASSSSGCGASSSGGCRADPATLEVHCKCADYPQEWLDQGWLCPACYRQYYHRR